MWLGVGGVVGCSVDGVVNVEMSAMDFERNPENVGGVAGYRWGGRVKEGW